MAKKKLISSTEAHQVSEAEVFMTLVIPAYNEQDRLIGMLQEAVDYLEEQYGHHGTPSRSSSDASLQARGRQGDPYRGWEIILVDDGSRDKTVAVALEFARAHLAGNPARADQQQRGPWSGRSHRATTVPPGTIRVVSLEQNRGKGGAVTHGMRHARGTYVVFADADGASRFSDLGKLVQGCERAKDKQGRAVGVGSRAHMVGTEAVVKVGHSMSSFSTEFLLLTRLLFLFFAALRPPQPPHARLPPVHLAADDAAHGADQGHAVRLQALLAAHAALHHPLHALRGLDL